VSRQREARINDDLVGVLREANDLWQFEYDAVWQANPKGFDLSPSLSRAQKIHVDGATHRTVQWYFDNLLPEEAMRTVLAKEAEVDAEDAFGLLAFYGSESAGSLVLKNPASPVTLVHGLKSLALADLNRRILNLPRVSLMHDAPKRMLLAGAQHKLLVVFRRGELFEPLPGTLSTHILKPNHQGGEYPASVMNEFFVMRLAQAVGLDVPPVYRQYAPEPVYIIERFDRMPLAGKKLDQADPDAVRRRHVIDTCQLLNKSRNFKYTGANLTALNEAIALCRAPAAARMHLFRWVLFNVLIGNGDNHLKNISFLVSEEGIGVAPAYDLLSTAVYDTKVIADTTARWPDTALALTIGTATRFSDIRRFHLIEAGQTLGLAKTTVEREIERMLKVIPVKADLLLEAIQAGFEKECANSPDIETAMRHFVGELRLLLAIRKVIVADMCRQLV
jgi:serine/threonine-protein kinase HipA